MLLARTEHFDCTTIENDMRRICARLQAGMLLTEHAVNRALVTFRVTGDETVALNAGVEVVVRVQKELEYGPLYRRQDAVGPAVLVERWWFIVGMLVVALAILGARVAGWLL